MDQHEHQLLHEIKVTLDKLRRHLDDRLDQKEKRMSEMAKTIADIQAESTALMTKVEANTNATAAVAQRIEGLKQQIIDLQALLDAAIAGGADPAALQAVSDNMATVAAAIDSDTEAEQVLANTPSANP